MSKLRKEFEDIVLEIEGSESDSQIVWPNEKKICYPQFYSKSKLKAKQQQNSTKLLLDDCSKNDNLKDIGDDLKQLDYLKSENIKKLESGELVDLKENLSLEILWIQQAIQSRIQVCDIFFFILN